jgi:hypothetical protein
MKHANFLQKVICLFVALFAFVAGRLLAQVPIAYYDFELNSARNTTVETTVQETISGVGSPLFSISSLTASHGSGNGASATYGGTNAGYAIGYYGFTTNATSSATDPSIQFGPFDCSGFSTLFVTADIVGIGTKMPTNIDLYYSTNNVTYTRIATTTSVTTDYTGISFTLPAAVNGTSSLYLRLIGFNAGASPSATDGVLRIDNLTLSARVITASKTLINTSLHGEGLSSGGTYLPAYTQLNINGSGIAVIPQGELLLGTVAGTQGLILTDGILDVSDKTLSFQISNGPIARNGTSQVGTITTNNNTIINFGNATNLGGGNFTIPANSFTNNPAVVNSINVQRTNILALGNPFLIDGGTLNLIAGRVDIGANSLGFQNGNTPIARTSGTLNAIGTSVVYFGTTGNTGGAAFTIPDGTFTNSPESFENITIQRTNALSLGNQGIIVNGTLHLESGVFNLGANSITFQNNDLPITRNTGTLTVTSSTNLIFGTAGNKGGAAFTIPNDLFSSSFSINSFTINRNNELQLGNQTLTINGSLTLTDGVLNISGRSLIFQNGNSPILRNGTSQIGTITTNNSSSITFGTTGNTGGNAFTIPANVFTNTPYTVQNFTVNRTNALNLNTQGLIVDGGSLTLTLGALVLGASTLTLQNTNTPIARTDGTLTVSTSSNISFGSTGNTGGNAFTIPNDVFTSTPILNNVTVFRSNTLTIGNQGLTINGTLFLEQGELAIAGNTLTFRNNDVPISRTSGTITTISSSNIIFGTAGNTAGAAFTLPNGLFTATPTLNSLTVNRTNSLTLGNQSLTLVGNLALTLGTLNDNGNVITVQGNITGTGIHASSSSGKILMNGSGGSSISGIASDYIELNNAAGFSLSGGLIINGTLELTNGSLAVGANTLIFRNGNTPITRSSGTITGGTTSNLVFGTVGNTGGSSFTIPSGTFGSANLFGNVSVNRDNSLSITNVGLSVNGTLTLTSGELIIGSSTLLFQNSNTPISRTNGTITSSVNSSLQFGSTGNLGGSAFVLPDNVFTNNPSVYNNVTIQRTNALTLGNQSIVVDGGTLNLVNGVFSIGAGNTLTFQNGNTPISRTSGTITVATTSNIAFGSTGNTGGAAFTIPDGVFTASPPSLNNFTVNRTNSLTLGNQGITVNGTLELTSGVVSVGSNTLTFQNGNTPISRTSGTLTVSTGTNLIFGTAGNTGGNSFTLPNSLFTSAPVSINNFTINRTNKLTIGNQAFVINGSLTLTLGEVDFLNTTLTFQNGNTPIARTSGSITLGSSGSLVFGTAGNTGGSAHTIPANAFTNNPLVITNFTVNRTNALTLGQSLTVDGGTLTLTLGALSIGANNTLTFQNANTPISRSSGTITVTTTSNIAFGSTGNTGGAAFTIPDGVFTASPPSLNNFTVNRTNSLTLGNQGITVNGTLELTSGVVSVGSNTLTFQNGNTPISRTSGTLTVSTGTNLIFGTAGNTGGNSFTLPNSLFTSAPVSINNFTINRTNKLTIGNQAFVINGSLTLTLGEVDFLNTTLTFQNGNTPIARTSGSITLGSSGSLVFGTAGNTGGSAHTIPANAFTNNPLVITNFTVNRTNALTLGQSLTVDGGTLTLTLGALSIGANNTLTLQNTNTPLSRTSGTITVATTSNIAFGSTGNTGGAAFTIPDNIFTATPPSLGSFTVNRTNNLTLGNQALTINGTLNLVAGNFDVGSNNLIFQNGDVPMARTSGTLITSGSPSYTFGTAGNTGGAAFTIPNDFFSTNPVTFTNVSVNRTNALTLGNQTFQLSGTLTLTLGEINIGNAGLTFHTSNTPIARNGTTQTGTIGGSSTGNITFGITGNTGGNAFTIPNNTFTSSPIEVNNFTINRTNALTHNNQSLTVNGTLNLVLGTYSFGNNTLTFQNGNTPMSRTSGNITLGSSANLVFGTSGNTGGSAFTIPASIFTSAPSISSFSINRTNSLTLNNQNLTLSGNLNLIGGVLNDAGRTITVNGNITGTATHEGSGIVVMPSSGSTISGATLANLQLNNTGGFSLTGSPTITAVLTLTSGSLSIGSHTLTFHTSNTPIVRTSGMLSVSTSSGLRFGTAAHMGGNAFTLPNDVFSGTPDFASFSVNRTNSLTLNNQNFTIRTLLSLEAGMLILPSNYLFTLKSTSITNTALVGTMGNTASIFYNSGASFRVERFIPQTGGTGRRAFRDLAPSVNSGSRTIFELWQENGTNGLDGGVYYGTHITGRAGASPGGIHATTGFDITQTGAGSLNTFDINTLTGVGAWKTWTSANASTNQTNDTLSAFKGYRITIRGNRLVNLYQNPQPTGMNDIAILRTRGRLVTGNVVFNTSGVTANGATNSNIRLNGTADGFTMIGNPYACAVDWDLLYTDASTSNISSTYFLFDPNVGTTGGYATYNQTTGISVPGASAINKFIQPGQAIFIQNTGTSPSITFKETHKVADVSALTTTFRTARTESTVSRLLIDLNRNVSGSFVTMDGVAIAFNNAYDNGEGPEDASKISNTADNLAVLRNNKQWAIEGRKEPTINDTVRLRVWSVTAGTSYQLSINTNHFQQINLQPYLYDYFTNTELIIPLNTISVYNFSVTSNAASFNERFIITFRANLSLPTTFLDFTLKRINTEKVNLQWQAKFYNLKLFAIERSIDGVNYYQIASVSINTPISIASTFNYVDETANGKMLYYRIKAVDKDNSYTYSKVLSSKQDASGVELLNNFIVNNELKLRVDNSVNQQLSIKIFDIAGKMLFTTNLKTEFNNIVTVPLSSYNIQSGFYFLVVNNQNEIPYIFKFFKQ